MNSLRFAVLRHTNHPESPDHYDIVLEESLGQDPEQVVLMKFETIAELNQSGLAIKYGGKVKRRYLQYEGPMNGNMGDVRRVDEGTYRINESYVEFNGNILNGIYLYQTEEKINLTDIERASILRKESK
ncbi:hypothetical protein J4407_01220 [Candidatus Pacearchaeota archaeon]|nr:hypothetical protein [Candidatus Pacearchaeota archaeon]